MRSGPTATPGTVQGPLSYCLSHSGWWPLVQPGHGQHGQFLGRGVSSPLHTWTAAGPQPYCLPPPNFTFLPRVRKGQRVSTPRPQSQQGPACGGQGNSPLGLGGSCPERCPFRDQAAARLACLGTPAASLAWPSPCHLAAWLMSKGQEEGPLLQPMGHALPPGTVALLPGPLALSPGEDRMEPWAPGSHPG